MTQKEEAKRCRRLDREKKTIKAMLQLYCKHNHRNDRGYGDGLCGECRDLLDFAITRITKCPFKENKPACSHCTIHCYRSPWRERMREVMRFSGPRMTFHHPILTLMHVLDKFRPVEFQKRKEGRERAGAGRAEKAGE